MQNKKKFWQRDLPCWGFWLLIALAVAAKLVLVHYQLFWTWIDGAPLDDELMFEAAQSIVAGNWLGDYNWLTLSKHMFFAVWLALTHILHIPYLEAGQLLWCGAALAGTMAFAPVIRTRKVRFLLFAALAFNPASTAGFTLRVYRDNIFPALCLLFFAGLIGYALRYEAPLKKGIPWLCCSGIGLALAWLTREDGVWLMPFALAGSIIILISICRRKGLDRKLWRSLSLAIPFVLLAVGINVMCAVNYAHYGVYVLSDFSGGGFSEAFGAMTRVEHEDWNPLVSVPRDVREKLYDNVPELEPMRYWLEEYKPIQNGYMNPAVGDYQTGSFYWVLRKVAQEEGIYDDPVKAQTYWKTVADKINELCDSGVLPASKGHRSSTTPPIRMEYVPDVLKEGIHSLWFCMTFKDCEPTYPDLSIGLPEDLDVWRQFLRGEPNYAAIEGTNEPYYGPLNKLAFAIFELIRMVYTLLLPAALILAAALQLYKGWLMLKTKNGEGLLLWTVLAGVLGMALLRCFMIAFMEVAAFNIGTYVMYLSTVHPLLILYAAAGVITGLNVFRTKKEV